MLGISVIESQSGWLARHDHLIAVQARILQLQGKHLLDENRFEINTHIKNKLVFDIIKTSLTYRRQRFPPFYIELVV